MCAGGAGNAGLQDLGKHYRSFARLYQAKKKLKTNFGFWSWAAAYKQR